MKEKREDYFYISIVENNVVKMMKVFGEIYKDIYGISKAKRFDRKIAYRITHIPTGYLLTTIYFKDTKDAKRFIDSFTRGIEEKFKNPNAEMIYQLKKLPRVKKLEQMQERYGEQIIAFGGRDG